MTEEKTTEPTGSTTDQATEPAPDSTPDSASESASAGTTATATEEGAAKKRWRGRSRADKTGTSDKTDKAEKTDKSDKSDKSDKASAKPARRKKDEEPAEKSRRSSAGAAATVKQVRTALARLVWFVCLLFALALAISALLIALKANAGNEGVRFVVDFAARVDLGIFSLTNPIKDFDRDLGPARDVKTALFNYGLGAIVWLIIGRVADRVIRP